MSSTDVLVAIKNLNVFLGPRQDVHVLKSVNLDLPTGQITALIGTSGSGKSITSMTLMGLLPPQARVTGEIIFKGDNLLDYDSTQWQALRGGQISMIFQEPMTALNPLMTCGEQILEAYLNHHPHASKAEAHAQVITWLNKVHIPHPEKMYHQYPHEISGGQKQRIIIAMAMINEPALIIADEPTTALDVIVQKEIMDLLKSLQLSTSTSILLITHDLALAQRYADNIVEMKQGRIIERTLQVESVPVKAIDMDLAQILLKVQHLTVQYNQDKPAVDNVSLHIFKGHTVGLIGGSGCGKTTLSKAILGLVKSSSGHIYYQDVDLTQLTARQWRAWRSKIQIVFQDPYAALNPKMRIGQALDEVLSVHTELSAIQRRDKIIHLLHKVQLSESDYYKYPHEFSGGQRQRICIARALILEPELVICDESVAALDIVIQKQILELLMELQQEFRLTYLFITHDINVVKRICDYVYVMEKGKIVEEGVTSSIIFQPQHQYTQTLIQAVP